MELPAIKNAARSFRNSIIYHIINSGKAEDFSNGKSQSIAEEESEKRQDGTDILWILPCQFCGPE